MKNDRFWRRAAIYLVGLAVAALAANSAAVQNHSGLLPSAELRAASQVQRLPEGDDHAPARHPAPREHPRLLGSRPQLQALAKERAAEYRRVVAVAREQAADASSAVIAIKPCRPDGSW